MNKVPVFVGLDYHQDSVQVCVMEAGGRQAVNRSCPNDWRAIAAAVEPHGPVAAAALEACAGSADLAEELALEAGWPVALAHPGYVARLKQSPDKSDYSDGRLLADLLRVGYLPKVWLAPAETRELRRLVRYRQQWADRKRETKLRIGALLREHRLRCGDYRPWTKGWLAWLKEVELPGESRWILDRHLAQLGYAQREIAAASRRLAKVTAGDPLIARMRELPGIGPVTAWVLRASVGRFDRFGRGKQFARFCGLSPRNASSGSRQADAGLVKAGDPLLRATLIQAAHRLKRTVSRWKRMAEGLRARGKPGSVVAAAVANRYARWLFHQLKDQERKDPGGGLIKRKSLRRLRNREASVD